MNRIGSYKNGNYQVHLLEDGTKIRVNNLDYFDPEFPESIDMKICNRCDLQCPMCHEQSVPGGDLANLNHPLLDSLKPYTELAIGGGNPLSHPDLEAFLAKMKEKQVVCNMTVNINHFVANYTRLMELSKNRFIHGLGISVGSPLPSHVVDMIAEYPNAVVHIIAGLVTENDLKPLFDHHIKLLILGYKNFGRGKDYYRASSPFIEQNIAALETKMPKLMKKFELISFDNLAIEQLHVKDHISKDHWDTCYMGDDGQFTMYIDLVKQQYAISSVSPRHQLFSNQIEEIFKEVKKESKNGKK